MSSAGAYRRYRIATERAPDIVPVPPRFRVEVRKARLIRHVLRALLEHPGSPRTALSRPCVYGVFSRPVGGLAPRESACVGCLRCTVEHPEMVRVRRNPDRDRLGEPYLKAEEIETLLYEAATGRVPVRGAGYRGRFGGSGWDGIWLDMSEIVRPTRDGIHGREFISTTVDIGEKPALLVFAGGEPVGATPRLVSVQLPFVLDTPRESSSPRLVRVLAEAARRLETLAVVPIAAAIELSLVGPHLVLRVGADDWSRLEHLPSPPAMIELDGWDEGRFTALSQKLPGTLVAVRAEADVEVLELVRRGVHILHLQAGRDGSVAGQFLGELVRSAHERLVEAGVREEVTLIGSGGLVMAEHVPKAIACGLDAVALDLPPLAALQARFHGDRIELPRASSEWSVQRIANLANSWRDQLLEVLGAMGMREVRRLRGEVGRLMLQNELEREAFGGIAGYGV